MYNYRDIDENRIFSNALTTLQTTTQLVLPPDLQHYRFAET